MLNRIKISTRLSVYSALLVTALIACTATGYFGIKKVNKNQEEITHVKLPGLNLLRAGSVDIYQAMVAQLSMVMFSDDIKERDSHLKAYKKNIRQSGERIEKLLKLPDAATSNPMLQSYLEARKEWRAMADAVVLKILSHETGKIREDIRLLFKKFDAMEEILDEMADARMEDIVLRTGKSSEKFTAVKYVLELISLTSILGAVLLSFVISRSIVIPVTNTAGMLKKIATGEGDLTRRLEAGAGDELGDLARWFNSFIASLQEMISGLASQVTVVDTASSGVSSLSGEMAAKAGESSKVLNSVARTTGRIRVRMEGVAQAMEEPTNNTNLVATAAEEMTATINEIAKNSAQARQDSEDAVLAVEKASKKMDRLSRAAESIGAVTETIANISSQTDLLALNATIEAARAGKAGKGFAVVAHEIKELASQTSLATIQIRKQIEGIQGTSAETVAEIQSISGAIAGINGIIAAIAAAIEEQSIATGEISANAARVSQGIRDANRKVLESSDSVEMISRKIVSVNEAVRGISGNSDDVAGNAGDLKAMAEQLKDIVGQFKY